MDRRFRAVTFTEHCLLLNDTVTKIIGHTENHSSVRNYLFLILQKIRLENHGLRLKTKSRFTQKKHLAISHFTGKKGHSQITKFKIPFTTLIDI